MLCTCSIGEVYRGFILCRTIGRQRLKRLVEFICRCCISWDLCNNQLKFKRVSLWQSKIKYPHQHLSDYHCPWSFKGGTYCEKSSEMESFSCYNRLLAQSLSGPVHHTADSNMSWESFQTDGVEWVFILIKPTDKTIQQGCILSVPICMHDNRFGFQMCLCLFRGNSRRETKWLSRGQPR